MIIKQVWTGNGGRNFFYMISCPKTDETLAIDPIDPEMCLAIAREHGWNIKYVLNTHEHGDHIGGNDKVIKETGAKLLGPAKAEGKITGIDEVLFEGSTVKVGSSGEFKVLETPGHTPIHISLFGYTDDTPHLLCGDTLFNAGVGHCRSGDANVLYNTFSNIISDLPDETKIYPGHEYMDNNLAFTIDREPDNTVAKNLLKELKDQDLKNARITTLGLERQINTFLRLEQPSIQEGIKKQFPNLPHKLDEKTVFLKLRELRNNW
jgi:hydroxyacylglutathione hydrolase